MKIVCDCGRECEFIKGETESYYSGYEYHTHFSDFIIESDKEVVLIKCEKCGKGVEIWT